MTGWLLTVASGCIWLSLEELPRGLRSCHATLTTLPLVPTNQCTKIRSIRNSVQKSPRRPHRTAHHTLSALPCTLRRHSKRHRQLGPLPQTPPADRRDRQSLQPAACDRCDRRQQHRTHTSRRRLQPSRTSGRDRSRSPSPDTGHKAGLMPGVTIAEVYRAGWAVF